jgi:hypothetical protein
MKKQHLLFAKYLHNEINSRINEHLSIEETIEIHIKLIRCNLLMLKLEDESIFNGFEINEESFLSLLRKIENESPEYYGILCDIRNNLLRIGTCINNSDFILMRKSLLLITKQLVETLGLDLERLELEK